MHRRTLARYRRYISDSCVDLLQGGAAAAWFAARHSMRTRTATRACISADALRLRAYGSPALRKAPAPPVVSVVRPAVFKGEGRGLLGSFPRASWPTSMTPAPPDLDRTIRNQRFHGRRVGRQRCRMERSDVAGHQASGNCACEGRSRDMHDVLRRWGVKYLGTRTIHGPATGFHASNSLH
jgi:hypothetical protein